MSFTHQRRQDIFCDVVRITFVAQMVRVQSDQMILLSVLGTIGK
jgi:hypothetical protein